MTDDAAIGITGDLGNGRRYQQLSLLGPYERRIVEAQRSDACEKTAIDLYKRMCGDEKPVRRYQTTVPPFLKWPIWPLRPARGKHAPTTFSQLRALLDSSEECLEVISEQSPSYTYRFRQKPYIHLKVTYSNGEVGPEDRRVLVALSHHARRHAEGRHDLTDFEIPLDEFLKLLGQKPDNRLRRIVSLALWGLSGTFVSTLEGDPLVQHRSWTTESFSLLPRVKLIPLTRKRTLLRYTIHKHARDMLVGPDDSTTTFDLLRSLALRRQPCAESLYLLLYDCAQWIDDDHIDIRLTALSQFLGLKIIPNRLDLMRRTVERACKTVQPVAGFLADYEWFGCGPSTFCRYYLADDRTIRRHSLTF